MDESNDASADGPARAVIIPMYDEATRIGRTLGLIADSALGRSGLEVILVDDGSRDGSAQLAGGVAAGLGLAHRVLDLGENRGKGAAVRAGMMHTRARARVFVDADLSVDIADVERCFEALESRSTDVAYGTRAHPSSRLPRTQPRHRVLSGRAYNLLLRRLGLTTERDTQCGLKGFTGEAADGIFGRLRTDRFGFDVEVLSRAERGGWRVAPLSVTWSHVDASRVRPIRDGASMAVAAIATHRALRRELGPQRDTGAEPMAVDTFDSMARVERTHWWFRAKRALVSEQLDRFDVDEKQPVVDIGCGTGGLVEALASMRSVIGVELDPHALTLARGTVPQGGLIRGAADHVPLRSGVAAAVTALDVIEHLDDDVSALRELARVAGDGIVIVAVPAYPWAWSDHDVQLGHRRRYTRATLLRAARAADLEVLRVTYFHSWLTPIALAVRRTPLRRLVRGTAEEASFVHPAVNGLLALVTRLEQSLMRRIDLPLGLSVLLVARARRDDVPR